jgi:hypothetical protein
MNIGQVMKIIPMSKVQIIEATVTNLRPSNLFLGNSELKSSIIITQSLLKKTNKHEKSIFRDRNDLRCSFD